MQAQLNFGREKLNGAHSSDAWAGGASAAKASRARRVQSFWVGGRVGQSGAMLCCERPPILSKLHPRGAPISGAGANLFHLELARPQSNIYDSPQDARAIRARIQSIKRQLPSIKLTNFEPTNRGSHLWLAGRLLGRRGAQRSSGG